MDDSLCNVVVGLVKNSPELYDPLNSAVKIEEENGFDEGWKGFQWFDLPAQPQTLKKLVLKKVLKVRWKTQSRTCYRLADTEAVKEALMLSTILMLDISEKSVTEEVSIELFDDVVGYEDVKGLFFKSLLGEKEDRVHFWMNGPPASAKTLFLFCLERLPGAKYLMGSRTTKAGLAAYLFEHEPSFLLVDEIDKMEHDDYAILLGLCQNGRVTEVIQGKTREIQLDTIVFAGSNRLRGIPEEVQSRFQILHFKEYSEAEFMYVSTHVLTRRQVSWNLAQYISQQVALILDSKDVRQSLRVAKLAKNRRQIDEIVRTLYKYRGQRS